MSESCPVLTPAERQVQDILQRKEAAMMATIHAALERASKEVAEAFQAVDSDMQPPPSDYFVAVAHQQALPAVMRRRSGNIQGRRP